MSASFQLRRHCAKLGTHTFADGVSKQQETSFPASSADMGEAQKVKGFRLAHSPSLPFSRREASKPDEPGFVAMQLQAELAHSLVQEGQELLGVLAMLETHHKIIRIPHQENFSLRFMPAPVMCPSVQDVMEIDIGQ